MAELAGAPLATVTTSVMTKRQFEVELEPGEHVIELRSEKPMKTRSLSVPRTSSPAGARPPAAAAVLRPPNRSSM